MDDNERAAVACIRLALQALQEANRASARADYGSEIRAALFDAEAATSHALDVAEGRT